MKLLHVLLRKAGKKVSSVTEGNEEYMEFFCYRADCSTEVLVHFFQVLLTWQNPLILFSALCNVSKKSLLKWYPVPARLSFDMARYSWQVQCACAIVRLSPCTLWPFSFSLKSRDAKMAGQQHLGLFLFLSGPFGAWFCEENGQREKMKCTSFPFEMYTKPTAGRPRSAAMPRLVPRQ